MPKAVRHLRFVAGDQLSHGLAALRDIDPAHDVVVMFEVMDEATYVQHHKKKIAFLFSAMRHFAAELEGKGLRVWYIKLDDPANTGSFRSEMARAITHYKPDKIIVTFPGEYRVLQDMKGWSQAFELPVEIRDDDRFLCTPEEFKIWAADRRQLRMEFFYREMRKKYRILIDEDAPVGGAWNYDSENRKAAPAGLQIPPPYAASPDATTQDVLELVSDRFGPHFGELEPFYFAVTRAQALEALNLFIAQRLPFFGDYQDAMVQGEPWMFHAHLSFYLNCGLLLPLEVIKAAEAAYRGGHVRLPAAEGFIRQVLGWREYVRGIYWLKMPDYATQNALGAERPLPEFFWTAHTQMNCLRQCIDETRRNAYAHHIQRLMVVGNFALLAGLDPRALNEWYLIVYADAFEWVEMPNVSGMVLYADDGLLASKPYAASGAYINKMSDYCKNCSYSVTQKNGPKACPFNYLYWDFFMRHEDKFKKNNRLAMTYRTLAKMDAVKKTAVQSDAQRFFKNLQGGNV